MSRKIHTKEEIQKRLDSLPPDIKNLLYSLDFDVLVQQVSAKNRLHIDQMALLAAETNEVMTGFSDPKDFESNLVESLQVDRAKAEAVAKDINEQLFVKIRESMKKMYEQQKTVTEKSAAPATQPAPAPSPTPKLPELHAADTMLSEKTVSVPTPPAPPKATQDTAPSPSVAQAKEGPKPGPYKTDPYREPAE